MDRLALISLGLLLLSFKAGFCETDERNLLKGKAYGSFMFFEEVPNALFFEDEITKNDSFEFRKAMRNHDIDTIVLNSPGGSIWEGLNIAGMIFDKELTTYVPKKGRCASACAFMFFAGSKRRASGKLGVHQFYSANDTKTKKIATVEFGSQFTVSEIIGFLNEFDTPPFVFEKMFAQKQMYYFSENEIQKLNTVTDKETVLATFSAIDNLMTEAIHFLEQENAEVLKASNEKTKDDGQSIKPAANKIQKLIQAELNRLGCNLGKVDGAIGPASKRALTKFNRLNKSNFDANAFFQSAGRLEMLKSKPNGFCPKVPKIATVTSEKSIGSLMNLNCKITNWANFSGAASDRAYWFPSIQKHTLDLSNMTAYYGGSRATKKQGSVYKKSESEIKWTFDLDSQYVDLPVSYTFKIKNGKFFGRLGSGHASSVSGTCSVN